MSSKGWSFPYFLLRTSKTHGPSFPPFPFGAPQSEECDPNVGLYRKYHRGIYDPRCDAKSKAYSPMYAASRLCYWAQKCARVGSVSNSWGSPVRSDPERGLFGFFSALEPPKVAVSTETTSKSELLRGNLVPLMVTFLDSAFFLSRHSHTRRPGPNITCKPRVGRLRVTKGS